MKYFLIVLKYWLFQEKKSVLEAILLKALQFCNYSGQFVLLLLFYIIYFCSVWSVIKILHEEGSMIAFMNNSDSEEEPCNERTSLMSPESPLLPSYHDGAQASEATEMLSHRVGVFGKACAALLRIGRDYRSHLVTLGLDSLQKLLLNNL